MQGERSARNRKLVVPPLPKDPRHLRSGVAPIIEPPSVSSLDVSDWEEEDEATRVYRPSYISARPGALDVAVAADEVTGTPQVTLLELDVLRTRLQSDGSSIQDALSSLRGSRVDVVVEEDPRQARERASPARGRWHRRAFAYLIAVTAVLAAAGCGFLLVRSSGNVEELLGIGGNTLSAWRQKYDTVVLHLKPETSVGAEVPIALATSASGEELASLDDGPASNLAVPVEALPPASGQGEVLAPEPAVAPPTDDLTAKVDEVVSPEAVPPEPVQDEARSRAAKGRVVRKVAFGTGTLRINARPWAEVYVDGESVGHTPQTHLELTAGWHSISLKNPELNIIKDFRVKITPGKIETRIMDM